MVKDLTEVKLDFAPCCDLCTVPRSAHYDCKTKKGQWGYLCEKHFKSDGIGLGLGKGQKIIIV